MLAKAIPNRPRSAGCRDPFGARIRYVCGKAEQIALEHLAGRWTDASVQMTATASLNPTLRQPAYHVVLTWAETECPSDDEMILAARMVLQDMGASAYQAVIAIHRDRINPHIHVVLNRVHPITGRSFSLSHDFARLERACRKVEHRMGWPQDRGRFDVTLEGDEVALIPKPAGHWQLKSVARAEGLRPDGRAVRAEERRTGMPSLGDLLPAAALLRLRRLLDDAATWAQAHGAVRSMHLRYIRHRSGARIVRPTDGAWMPAGQLGTGYGLGKLAARLGAYRADVVEAPGAADPDPSPFPVQPIARYHPDLAAILARQREDRAVRARHTAAWRTLHDHLADQRARVTGILGRARMPTAQALRTAMREQERAARKALRQARKNGLAIQSHGRPDRSEDSWKWPQARRYRDAIRIGDGTATVRAGHNTHVADHTDARQSWVLAGLLNPNGLPMPISNVLKTEKNTIRITGETSLLVAHRNLNGSLVGFEHLDLGTGDPRFAQGGRQGICILGPKDADKIVIAADAATGLAVAVVTGGSARVVIAGPLMKNDEVEALRLICRDRHVTIAAAAGTPPDTVRWLSDLLPGAGVIRLNVDAMTRSAEMAGREPLGRDEVPHPP